MNTKIKYTDEPLGKVEVIADMLPSPEELAFKEDTVKVTISLSKSSVDFFKREAKKHDTKYQQMIRRLLDAYTHAQDRHITHMRPPAVNRQKRPIPENSKSSNK